MSDPPVHAPHPPPPAPWCLTTAYVASGRQINVVTTSTETTLTTMGAIDGDAFSAEMPLRPTDGESGLVLRMHDRVAGWLAGGIASGGIRAGVMMVANKLGLPYDVLEGQFLAGLGEARRELADGRGFVARRTFELGARDTPVFLRVTLTLVSDPPEGPLEALPATPWSSRPPGSA